MNSPNKRPTINIAIPAFLESSAGKNITQIPRRINPKLKINEEYLKIRLDVLNKISVNFNMSKMRL
jgi:hypothetical protein